MTEVSLTACPDYDESRVFEAVNKAVELVGGIKKFVKPGQKVLIKPNMMGGHPPEAGITTHPMVLKAMIRLVINAGGKPAVGDSPGYDDPRKAFVACGFKQVCDDTGALFADFTDGIEARNPTGLRFKSYTIARAAREADVIINLPKLKTHHLTGITGAVKNMFGCVPGLLKTEYHVKIPRVYDFSLMLLDIGELLKPSLTIMDAVKVMEGEGGPVNGALKNFGLIAASDSPSALDHTICRLIDLDPVLVPTLKAAMDNGFDPEKVKIIGEMIKRPDFKKISVIPNDVFPGPPWMRRFISNLASEKPVLNRDKCIHCGICFNVCKSMAIDFTKKIPVYNYNKCIRCFCCAEMCPQKAIDIKRGFLSVVFHKLVKIIVEMRSRSKRG